MEQKEQMKRVWQVELDLLEQLLDVCRVPTTTA